MTLSDEVRRCLYDELNSQGLTLRKAAERMGRSHGWLGTKLRGGSDMKIEDLEEIASALGIDAADVILAARLRASAEGSLSDVESATLEQDDYALAADDRDPMIEQEGREANW